MSGLFVFDDQGCEICGFKILSVVHGFLGFDYTVLSQISKLTIGFELELTLRL